MRITSIDASLMFFAAVFIVLCVTHGMLLIRDQRMQGKIDRAAIAQERVLSERERAAPENVSDQDLGSIDPRAEGVATANP